MFYLKPKTMYGKVQRVLHENRKRLSMLNTLHPEEYEKEKEIFEQTIQEQEDILYLLMKPSKQSKDEYDKLASLLDSLLDVVGEDENHVLMGFVDVVSHMISIKDEEWSLEE